MAYNTRSSSAARSQLSSETVRITRLDSCVTWKFWSCQVSTLINVGIRGGFPVRYISYSSHVSGAQKRRSTLSNNGTLTEATCPCGNYIPSRCSSRSSIYEGQRRGSTMRAFVTHSIPQSSSVPSTKWPDDKVQLVSIDAEFPRTLQARSELRSLFMRFARKKGVQRKFSLQVLDYWTRCKKLE